MPFKITHNATVDTSISLIIATKFYLTTFSHKMLHFLHLPSNQSFQSKLAFCHSALSINLLYLLHLLNFLYNIIHVPHAVKAIVGSVDSEHRGPRVRLRHASVPLEHYDLRPDLIVDLRPLVQDLLYVFLLSKKRYLLICGRKVWLCKQTKQGGI